MNGKDRLRTLDVLGRVCALQDALLQTERPTQALFEALLEHFVAFTGSAYGFIGEVFHEGGRPFLRSHAISNIAWNDETLAIWENAKRSGRGMEFRNLETLFGRVLTTGEVLLSNTPTTDARAGGLPPGHPPLDAFAGIPVLVGGQFIGMIGLANRPEGYDAEVVQSLAPLVGAAGSFFYMLRVHRARAAAEAAVARRVAFERLVLEISSHFNHAAAEDFDAMVDSALARVGRFVEADRSYLFLVHDDDATMSNTHEWCAEGISPEKDNLQGLPIEAMGFVIEPWRRGESIVVPDVDALPPEADWLRDTLSAQGIRSAVWVPLLNDGRLVGFVGFDAVRSLRGWSTDDAALLEVLVKDIGHLLRRTRAAQRLAESELRFRLIASHIRQAFFLVTSDYRQMLYVSPAFEAIWGMPVESVYADPLCWLSTLSPDARPYIEATVARAHVEPTTTEYLIRRPDGVERWVRVDTLPVREADGSTLKIAGIAEDVTEQRAVAEMRERHNEALEAAVRARTEELTAANGALRAEVGARVRAEADLLRSTSALRTVADTMPVAVLIVDDALVRFANQDAETLLGLTVGADLAALHPALIETVRTEGAAGEVALERPDGMPREVRVLVRPVDFEGRPCRVLAALDVTDQRRAERMLREHNQTISRLAYIGNMEGLASAVAHELNQPLNAIVMWSGGLQTRLSRSPVPATEVIDIVERMRVQALRAGELMRRLRSFSSRDEEKRLRLDIDTICERAVRQLTEVAGPTAVHIEQSLGAGGACVIGDAVQLEVVITNLLRNAVEATPLPADKSAEAPGPALARVELASTRTADGVRVTVRDFGVGVPPALRSSIFEPLVSTKQGGMGIGLSIARTIVEAHRGHLTLGEPDGPGALFEVTLPAGLGG
jgi:PAS domain S-box-containing protein